MARLQMAHHLSRFDCRRRRSISILDDAMGKPSLPSSRQARGYWWPAASHQRTGAGSPTVIMEGGPNDSSVIWQLVQPQVSKFTRVCSYDRAGFGWSDAPNEPRSSLNIANELARLLTRGAVPRPYVLVWHDFDTLDLLT